MRGRDLGLAIADLGDGRAAAVVAGGGAGVGRAALIGDAELGRVLRFASES